MPGDTVPLTRLRAEHLADVLVAAEVSLRAHAPGIDRLDGVEGDTGANLVAAMGPVVVGLGRPDSLTQLADRLDRATVHPGVEARGTATVLLRAFLAGVAELCRNADSLDADRLAMALESGADRAEQALRSASIEVRPGSFVTVARAVADAALAASDDDLALADLVVVAADGGLDALEATPLDWPPLADAGVVDAGAAGLLVVVDALVAVVHGDDPEPPAWDFHDEEEAAESVAASGRYTVSMRLDPLDAGVPLDLDVLRRLWQPWCGSIDVTPDGGGIAYHVVLGTDSIGTVIEATLTSARPSEIDVRDTRG